MEVEIQNENFRPGTHTEIKDVIFKFTLPGWEHAALGDSIAWLPAIIHVAKNYNYVRGHLIVPEWFMVIAMNVLKEYPHWKVYSKIPDSLMDGVHVFEMKKELPNATVMPLVDLGFIRFGGFYPVPKGAEVYPLLDLERTKLHKSVPELYAVLTPGSSAVTRKMPATTYNGISEYLLSKGITPVHLGTESMNGGKRAIDIDSDYDRTLGIDLVGKTSIIEAAKIMEDAAMVIGIDNGLLHLAAMTDTTILYGFTMVGPNHRRITRKYGQTFELYGDKEKLPCLFCQENVRFFFGHNFEECIYKLNVPDCVKMLNLESWTKTIDLAMGEGNG